MTADDEPQPEAPGWYVDPYGRMRYRWWDGSEWSAYAADSTVQWDELPLASRADAEPPPTSPRGIGVAVLGYGVGVALAGLISVGLVAADRPGGRTTLLVVSQLGLWAGLLTACWFVSRRRGTRSFARDFGWRIRGIDVGLGFAGALVARVISGLTVAPIPIPARSIDAPESGIFEKVTNTPWDWVALILIVCVGAPLIEELFFRGLLQSRLVAIAGTAPGIVIASVLFGAAHLIAWQGPLTLVYGMAIAGGGVVLGLMFQLTGRLGPSVMAHMFFNAQAVLAVALLT